MSLFANIIIKNNIIDQGFYTPDGISTTFYAYTHNAWVYGASLIENNIFMNPASNADMLNITDADCIVRNNKFMRNVTSINSYISHHSIFDVNSVDQITDNIFDAYTIDGASTELVKGLNPGSIYTRNKNQTGFIYIPIYDNEAGINGIFNTVTYSGGSFTWGKTVDVSKISTNLLTVFDQGGTIPTVFKIGKSFHLGDYLEKGMLVTGVRVGGFCPLGTLTDFGAGSAFGVELKSHNGVPNMDATQFAVLTPNANNMYLYLINSSGQFTNLQSTTQFTSISFSDTPGGPGDFFGFTRPDFFRAGNGYQMEVEFFASITFSSDTWILVFTPIEVAYIW